MLHAAALIQLRLIAYHPISPLQLVRRKEPSIFRLRKFSCGIRANFTTAIGPHRKLGSYVGFESPSIIKYLEHVIGDLHMTQYADCIFDENNFLALGGGRYHSKECREIDWNVTSIQFLDPHTKDSELEVRRIINLQQIANSLLDTFTNLKGVTKS